MIPQTQQNGLAQKVHRAIFSTRGPGDAPLSEQTLAERFGVSRTPIREILQDLQRQGVVERHKKKGVSVRKPSPKELADIYDIRAVLEGHAARMAAVNANHKDVSELTVYANRFTQSRKKGNLQRCEEAHIAFHNKIIVMSGNDSLMNMMGQFRIIRRAFWFTHDLTPDDRDYVTPYPHEAIVEKIEAGDAEGSCELMQAHIRIGKIYLIEKALGLNLATLTRNGY